MELIDCLSNEERTLIEEYVSSYANIEKVDINKILKYWNINKKKMYKALGNNLRVSIPVDIPCDQKLFIERLNQIYKPPFFAGEDLIKNPFIVDLMNYMSAHSNWQYRIRYCDIGKMFSFENIQTGQIKDSLIDSLTGKIVVPKGTKVIKGIQKFLKYVGYDNMDLFEYWRNEISNLTTTKHLRCNLVFSIHPIDFLTMSDNRCGWTSCMSWQDGGSYSAGVIEMMNSNCAIIAYLESKKPFVFNFHRIPNKSYRVLCYLHKDILLIGKSYPYVNDKIAQTVLDNLRRMVYNTMNWKYQYINQPYLDMKKGDSANGNYRLLSVKNFRKSKKHNILVYTNGMYNDITKDRGFTTFWCCRNWVPKTIKINLSGPFNCMRCGKRIMSQEECNLEYDDENIPSYGKIKICDDCYEEHRCYCCDRVYEGTEKISRELIFIRTLGIVIPESVCKDCLKTEHIKIDNVYVKKNDVTFF